jgi:preprotein translocase subunit YajC
MLFDFILLDTPPTTQPATGTTSTTAPGTPAGPGAKQEPGGFNYQMLIMMGLMVVVFYFFMIRPQQKRAKAERQFRDSMQKGDKVMTIGGMYGKIASTDEGDGTMMLEIDTNVKIRVDKSAVKAIPPSPADKK